MKVKEYIQKFLAFMERPIPLLIFSGLCFWRLSVLNIQSFDKGLLTGWIIATLFYKFVGESQRKKSDLKPEG